MEPFRRPRHTAAVGTYDANGNQTAAGARTFTYDMENRVTSTTSGKTTNGYTYGGDGNRSGMSVNGTLTTKYVWAGRRRWPRSRIAEPSATAD